MVYRIIKIKIYILIALIYFFLVVNYGLILLTLGSFFFSNEESQIKSWEFIFYIGVFPLCS